MSEFDLNLKVRVSVDNFRGCDDALPSKQEVILAIKEFLNGELFCPKGIAEADILSACVGTEVLALE